MGSKTFLVTGGSGFIGSALVKRLLRDGHNVRVFDNHSRGSMRRLQDVAADIEVVVADIRDGAAVSKAARGVDSVVHLAYVNGTEFFYSKPALVLDVGVRGMLNVIDACREQGVGEMILASTSEAYQTPPVVPTPEDVPLTVPDILNPRYSYGGGKIACELLAVNFGREFFDRVLIFRPHNVYGPDMGWEHVLPQFVGRTLEAIRKHPTGRLPFPIQGDGRQTRAFVYIDDFAEGFMTILAKGTHLGVYHIGNPEEVTIAQVATAVVGHFGREIDLRPGPEAAGGTLRRCPDISRLRALGYEPRVPFAQGLAPTADWYTANQALRPAA